jgi:hypothetical protein
MTDQLASLFDDRPDAPMPPQRPVAATPKSAFGSDARRKVVG